MAFSDWFPPYWRDTLDFQQIKLALDDGVQPIMDFVEYFFGMCSNASSWPDEVLTEVLLKCGYPEAGNASRERKQELIRRALRTRGLITEQVFVHYLKDAFDVSYEDPWPYTLTIDHANMHVDVVVPCEDCSDGMRPRNGGESFRYDNCMADLQYSFPAGVSLVLQCDMPETEIQRYYGAVTSVVEEYVLESDEPAIWSYCDMYDAQLNWAEGEKSIFGGYRINGNVYANEIELNDAGYYLQWTSDAYLGSSWKFSIQRARDGAIKIVDRDYFQSWSYWHNNYGYTETPSQSIIIYNKYDGWASTPGYYNPENEEYYVYSAGMWYSSIAELNNNGFYLVQPTAITVGVSSVVPQFSSRVYSEYYWVYHFTAGDTLGNLWTPQYYANNALPTGAGTNDETVPNAFYDNVWIWDGSRIIDMAQEGWVFKLAIYSNLPEFYTDNNQNVTAADCALLVDPVSPQLLANLDDFDLPSGLFTINGTTINWDSNHPMYNLFYGKTVYVM